MPRFFHGAWAVIVPFKIAKEFRGSSCNDAEDAIAAILDDDISVELVRSDIPFSCSHLCGEICELLLLSSKMTVIFHGYFDGLFSA